MARNGGPIRNSRAKYWCFTLNNPTDEETEAIKGLGSDSRVGYVCFGVERGESGTLHLQGYIELVRRLYTKQVKDVLGRRAHVEPRRGDGPTARDYCKKGDQSHEEWSEQGMEGPNFGKNAEFWESGDLAGPQGRRSDLEEIRDKINEAAINNMHELAMQVTTLGQWTFGKSLLVLRDMDSRPKPYVYWLYGSTGSGKSREMFAYTERMAAKDFKAWSGVADPDLKWFDGYWGQQIALFDDFRPAAVPFNHLLRLTDRYPYRVQVKGSTVAWKPRIIIFTTPKSISGSFGHLEHTGSGGEDIAQLVRRVDREFDFDNGGAEEFKQLIDEHVLQEWN